MVAIGRLRPMGAKRYPDRRTLCKLAEAEDVEVARVAYGTGKGKGTLAEVVDQALANQH